MRVFSTKAFGFYPPPSLAIREQEQRRRAAVYRRRCRTNVGRINNILYIGQLRRIDEFKVVRGRRSARFNIVSTSSATSVTSRRPKNIFFFFLHRIAVYHDVLRPSVIRSSRAEPSLTLSLRLAPAEKFSFQLTPEHDCYCFFTYHHALFTLAILDFKIVFRIIL